MGRLPTPSQAQQPALRRFATAPVGSCVERGSGHPPSHLSPSAMSSGFKLATFFLAVTTSGYHSRSPHDPSGSRWNFGEFFDMDMARDRTSVSAFQPIALKS